MSLKKTNLKISSLTLAAGDTFFNNDEEKKFFFKSLINSKKILFENAGILENYFLISNPSLYKEKIVDNLIFNDKIINYGSLGSLIYFVRKLKKLPDFLLVNYLDKKISTEDLDSMLLINNEMNIVSGTSKSNNFDVISESFFHENKDYLFNGFLILNKETIKKISKLDDKYFYHNLPYIVNSTLFKESKFFIYKNKDQVKEVRKKIDVAKILLGSKSKSIHNLRDIKTATIPNFIVLNKSNLNDLEKKIDKLGNKLIIRSDSEFEDSFNESNAGKFLSIGPIYKKESLKIQKAIESVFNSYPSLNIDSRVMVQDYVENIKRSGVITTRVLQNGSPYICISISDGSKSDEVTAGTSNKIKNIYIHKDIKKLTGKFKKYQKILNLVIELIEYISYDLLDIEFAIDEKNKIYLLQVRPLLVDTKLGDNKSELLMNIRSFQQLQNKSNSVYGSRTVLSNMSDWNPAEMLGESPNYLSLSLYKTFITNDSWYIQRKEFGYRGDVRDKLMFNFGNKCFIDVRASLNSFLTKSISDNECERIIDFQIDTLINNPELHDKIEFEIAETSYVFGLDRQLHKRYKDILPKETISIWLNDLKALEKNYLNILNRNNKKIISYFNNLSPSMDFFDKRIVKAIKNNMAVPFSHHARLAFIYFSHLNNFVQNDVISETEKQNFLNNLNTISSRFSRSLFEIKNKKMSYRKFFSIYGHVRPNNYDLNSKNLQEEGREFIDFLIENLNNDKNQKVDTVNALTKIENYLKLQNYKFGIEEWYQLFQNSIISRENSKFMYSKAIDLTLNQIKNCDDLDKTNIENLNFEILVKTRKVFYEKESDHFELPDIITDSNDFLFFENLNTKPNFIGQNSVKAELSSISEKQHHKYKNKIILLPNADPGWDWILNLPIKGMVTKYGGPNSHMAIRASEKNITSVFGVGDDLFKELQNSKIIEIDPLNKKLYFN